MKTLFSRFTLLSALVMGCTVSLAETSFNKLIQKANADLKLFADQGSCQSGGNCSASSASDCKDGACDSESTDEDADKPAAKNVGEVLKELSFVSGKPKSDADYYIYFYSASWCPPCRKLMPDIVKEYRDIRASEKVELILIGYDQSAAKVKNYVTKYKAAFPAIWKGAEGVDKLPGHTAPGGIPAAIIVDKKGNVITKGYGQIILEWEKYTINNPAQEEEVEDDCADGSCDSANTDKSDSDCSDGSCAAPSPSNGIATKVAQNSVGTALKEIEFISGEPKTDAQYYIYLYSAGTCPPCRKLMPKLVAEYEDIRESEQVELILLGADVNEEKVKEYVDRYDVNFPATWANSHGVYELPGNTPPNGIPTAIIVDKEGNVLSTDHGQIILEWEKHTIERE